MTCVVRSEWPMTVVQSPVEEYIEYRETYTDRQGRAAYDRDAVRRRFHSVRIGRANR